MRKQFADLMTYSSADRTAVSVRDGVLEYLGVELGPEPEYERDRVYTVYRSPATIANAAYRMPGIPLTDEHVSMDGVAPDTGSVVAESTIVDLVDEATGSRLAVRNTLKVSDGMAALIAEKKQLSLGYNAELVPHSRWDFEQIDIVPHHLAAVPAGRCGPLCSFLDRKPTKGHDMPKIHKAFTDEEGAISLERVVEIATALPEAIRKVPVDKLTELMPAMLEVMGYAKEQGAMPEEEQAAVDEDAAKEEGMKDEDAAAEEEDKPKFSDADVVKRAQAFADKAVKQFAEVVSKARNFLDENYDYTGKTANDVMRAALATQSTDKFTDAELSIAFKLLRKSGTDYSNFGDSSPEGSLTARIKTQLEG